VSTEVRDVSFGFSLRELDISQRGARLQASGAAAKTPAMMWRLKRLAAYRKPFSIFSRAAAGIDDLRFTLAPVMVEWGEDASVVVIAFTGGAAKLMLPVYEFFDTTKSLGYSRILLRDQYHRHYHRGIDNQRPDFPSLIGYLREEIERLSPKKILCIGTSSGGYAAIRAGHELGADYVHAFAPQTGDLPAGLGAPKRRYRLWPLKNGLSRHSGTKFIELSRLLKDWNRKTIYYVHYGRGCRSDRYHAERLLRAPGVVSIGYPSDAHLIAIFLAKKGFLTKALAISNQDRLVEIAKKHFHDGLEIHEPRREATGDRPG
jgi:hypothetical protein